MQKQSGLQCHNINSKFNENLSIDSKVIIGGNTSEHMDVTAQASSSLQNEESADNNLEE
jgi:hypothetical protein